MVFKNRKKKAQVCTLIGKQAELLGDIQFTGGLHIDGTVKGSVTAENDAHSMLSLSESAIVEGDVRVPCVVLNGTIIGDVYGAEHIDIAAKARITGDVYYNSLEMAKGAEINGKLIHMSEPDQRRPEEARSDIAHIGE